VRCDEEVELDPQYVYVPIEDILKVFDDIYKDENDRRRTMP